MHDQSLAGAAPPLPAFPPPSVKLAETDADDAHHMHDQSAVRSTTQPVAEDPDEHEPAHQSEPAPASTPQVVVAVPQPTPDWFTARLLASSDNTALKAEIKRAAIGLGLASLYGLALGARHGGTAFFIHALGVPAALAAIAALGVPALYITLAIFNAPIDAAQVGRAASRATATGGLVLAGLAPAAALYVVSSNENAAAAFAGVIGLFFAGIMSLRRFLKDLTEILSRGGFLVRGSAVVAFFCFSVFAAALALRIWLAALPLIGGLR